MNVLLIKNTKTNYYFGGTEWLEENDISRVIWGLPNDKDNMQEYISQAFSNPEDLKIISAIRTINLNPVYHENETPSRYLIKVKNANKYLAYIPEDYTEETFFDPQNDEMCWLAKDHPEFPRYLAFVDFKNKDSEIFKKFPCEVELTPVEITYEVR